MPEAENTFASALHGFLSTWGRLLTKSDLTAGVRLLREWLKPSERDEEEQDWDRAWFYLEYRRAKSIEHGLLREKARRRGTPAYDLAAENEQLRAALEALIGAVRVSKSMHPALDEPVTTALRLTGGAHTGHHEMRALLRSMMADAAGTACHSLAERFASHPEPSFWRNFPPLAQQALTEWRRLHLQQLSANQHHEAHKQRGNHV